MSIDRTRFCSACDKTIEYMLYTMVFFIPTSKSVVEVFATLSIIIWLIKNALRSWDWALEKRKSFVPPVPGAGMARIIAPAAVITALLVYSAEMISLAVVSHHFEITGDIYSAGIFIPITVFAALLIAIFFVIMLHIARSDFGMSLKASAISFICISMVTSSFTSQNLGLSAEAFLFKTMEYVLIFLIAADVINTPRRVFNIVSSLLIGAFFSGLDGLYQRVSGYDLFRKFPLFEKAKVTASFKAPNGFGAYLATVLPLSLAFIIFNVTNWKRKIGLIGLSLVLAACLLLTFTRGAWMGFIAGFIFLFIFAGGKRFIIAVIALALLVGLIAAVSPPVIKGQLNTLVHLGRDISSMDRILIWKTGWKMFVDKPVFGHGLNTFMSVFERFGPAGYTEVVYAHNCYLQTAAETGITGLLVFLWLCASVILSALSGFFKSTDKLVKASALGAAACLVAILTNSAVDTILYSLPLAVLFWSLCGLAAARIQPE